VSASTNIDELLRAWSPYVATIKDWESLVTGVTPKATDCGPVYEIPNPIERPNESFAISDMRNMKYTGPHYHTGGEVEVYIVLSGHGKAFVGGKEQLLEPGSVCVTPRNTTHFTVPTENLVLAVINTPPFNPANAVSITETDSRFGFDKVQFEKSIQAV
jgi:mannose-6-phosphate isomerase-like protein (cupin superfamily)